MPIELATDLPRNIAVMIDIETLSLKPNAFVTQVGVAVGDLDQRQVLHTQGWLISPQGQHDSDVDFGTIQWWMQQDRSVAAKVFSSGPRIDGWDLWEELKTIVDQHPDCTVWGSPAMFDLPILTNLFHGRKPWRYNYERDMMTLYKLFDPDRALQPALGEGDAHDAEKDALNQLLHLFALNEKIKSLTAPEA